MIPPNNTRVSEDTQNIISESDCVPQTYESFKKHVSWVCLSVTTNKIVYVILPYTYYSINIKFAVGSLRNSLAFKL